MRQDTPYGPIWLFPDYIGEKTAKQGARIDLLWPDLDGFVAMHFGTTGIDGGFLVRAPKAALEKAGCKHTDSAAEYPVAEGTVWPPIHIPVPMGGE